MSHQILALRGKVIIVRNVQVATEPLHEIIEPLNATTAITCGISNAEMSPQVNTTIFTKTGLPNGPVRDA